MKIWFVATEYPPMYGGGISTYVSSSAKFSAEAGHDVVVFTIGDIGKPVSVTKELDNLTIVRINYKNMSASQIMGYCSALSFQFSEKIYWYSKRFKIEPDVIEFQDYNAPAYYFLQKKLTSDNYFNKTKTVIYLHTPTFELNKINQSPEFKMPNYWISQMEKFCLMAADGVLCPSEFLKNEIKKTLNSIKIKKIIYPYLPEKESAKEKWYQDSSEKKYYLYMGRLEQRKGVLLMLEEFEKLWLENKHIKLKLIGSDTLFHPKNKKIGEIIKEKYSNRINEGLLLIQDSIKVSKLNKEIMSSKAIIIPSIYENYPYTGIQSMWSGTPLIVSKQGGQSEMIDENCGLVFDWNKENDLYKTINKYEKFDNNLKKEMGKHAFFRIKNLCDSKKRTEEKIDYFQKLINKKNDKKYFPFINNDIYIKDKKIETLAGNSFKKGLLSIIIPYYNLGSYLTETIKSALKNNYNNSEIIIVDDGSTDKKSIETLNYVEQNFPQIRIIKTKNKGLPTARNIGAENARGEFIAFLDADNLIDATFYEKSIKILNKYKNVGFVYSWLEYFDGAKGIWPTFNTEFPLLLSINMLDALSVVRKDIFLKFGINRKEMIYGMEDWDSWISICENGYNGVSIPEPLLKYRVRKESMSRQFNNANILYSYKEISNRHKETYKKYGVEIFNILQSNGPGYLWNNPTVEPPELNNVSNNSLNQSQVDSAHKELFIKIYKSKFGQTSLRWFYRLRMQKILKLMKIID